MMAMVAMVKRKKVQNCSWLATLHQPLHRLMFSSFCGKKCPMFEPGSSCPVIGETIRGMWMPIPMFLSRT
jgi:hypothetical protein